MKDGKDMLHIMTILEIMVVIGLLIFGFGAHEVKADTFPSVSIEYVDAKTIKAQREKEKKIYDYIDKNLIIEGNIPKDKITLMKRTLKSQNLDLIKNFMDWGGKFYLLDDDNFDKYYGEGPIYDEGGMITGFIDYCGLKICIRASMDDKTLVKTVNHEMGHYMNTYEYNAYSSKPGWQEVKEREFGMSGFDNYFSQNSEYFAESYAAYRTNQNFRYTCPMSYDIMKLLDQNVSLMKGDK